MPFVATWMELENVILSEISQTEKEKYHMASLICGIYKELTYKRERHSQTQKMNLWMPEEGILRESGMDIYTLLYSKWITNKDLLYRAQNSAQCYKGSLKGRGFWVQMDKYMYPWVSSQSPETITALLISYTPKQYKKFEVQKIKLLSSLPINMKSITIYLAPLLYFI